MRVLFFIHTYIFLYTSFVKPYCIESHYLRTIPEGDEKTVPFGDISGSKNKSLTKVLDARRQVLAVYWG